MTKYYVEWKTEGFEYMANKRNGPYDTLCEAEWHKRDIAGYVGVFDCEVVPEEDDKELQ